MRRNARAVVRVLVCTALMAGLSVIAGPAGAVDSAALTSGDLLPVPATYAFPGAYGTSSTQYILTRHAMEDDTLYGEATILRPDGTVVRSFGLSAAEATVPPEIVDDAVIRRSSKSSGFSISVTSAETGAVLWTAQSAVGGVLHADDAWMLVSTNGPSANQSSLHFRWPDGTDTEVAQPFDAAPSWVGGDSDTAFVDVAGTPYAIDPHSGTVTGDLFSHPGTRLVAVSTQMLVGLRLAPGSSSSYIVTTRDRSSGAERDSAPFDPTASQTQGYVPFGSGVAVRTTGPALRMLDFATGTLGDPLFGGSLGAQPLGDGSLLVSRRESDSLARLAIATDPAAPLRTVADYGPLGTQVLDLHLHGGSVFASLDPSDRSYQPGIWTRPSDGPGSWSQTQPGIFDQTTDHSFAMAGQVVLVSNPGPQPQYSGAVPGWRVVWPGGSRDFNASSAVLDRGSEFVMVDDHEVDDARTGAVVASWSDNRSRTMDGDWLWGSSDATGQVTATDLTHTRPDRTVQLGAACGDSAPDQVWGRWVLVRCGTTRQVIDTQGEFAPRPVADGAELGNGFVASLQSTPGGRNLVTSVVVTDLENGQSRLYGPVLDQSGPASSVAVNDDGSPDLVYLDSTQQVRHVDLHWLGLAQQEQAAAPTPELVSGPDLQPFVTGSQPRSVNPTWRFQDRSGASASGTPMTYDVRSRDSGRLGTWTYPSSWQALSDASVTDSIDPGAGRCYSARAHDGAGGVSPWSPPACQSFDVLAPDLVRLSDPQPFVATTTANQVVTSWEYQDRANAVAGSGVSSYDVRRNAGGATPWSYPADWQNITSPGVSMVFEPDTLTCFEVRARDAVGNTSQWSAPQYQLLDGHAPTAVSSPASTGSVAASGSVSVHLVWSYLDPSIDGAPSSGLADFDVRRGTRTGSGPVQWETGSTGTFNGTEAVVDDVAYQGASTCWAVRPHDRAGNTGDWSDAVCRRVDTTDPQMGTSTASPVWLTHSPDSMSYAVTATDDGTVVSYEIQTRITPPGAADPGWTIVADASPSGSYTIPRLDPGSVGCIRARARDDAGRLAPWAATQCSVAPVDDRNLTVSGRTRRLTSPSAVNGTLLRLQRRGSAVTSAPQAGTQVGIWLLRGRGLGKVDVYVGATHLGRIICSAPGARRGQLVIMGNGHWLSGNVRLVSAARAPVDLDAIAVLH